MSKKHDFLDYTQQHTLTEQECELITFFRFFSKSKRNYIMKMIIEAAMLEKKAVPKGEKLT